MLVKLVTTIKPWAVTACCGAFGAMLGSIVGVAIAQLARIP